MDRLTLYGGTGFIGGRYVELYGSECVVNAREDYKPKSNDALYFISTTDNYNVFSNPQIDIDTNLRVLVEVLEHCRKRKFAGVFNFISSWFVYGQSKLPATEQDACTPRGFYSITKRAAEQLLISYCETYQMNYRILRLANVIGKGDKNASAKKNALQFLISKLKANEEIELYDDGEFVRDYIHVADGCRAIRLVVTTSPPNAIYNISNGIPIVFKDVIEYARKRIGSRSVVKSIPQKDFHRIVQVKSMYLDNSKIVSLGYKPEYDVYRCVDELID